MTDRVLRGVLAFAVLEVGRLHEDAGAVRAGVLAVGVRVVHAHHHRMRRLTRTRRPAIMAHVADDHRSVAERELRAVVLADLHALDEPERRAQPVDRLAHVRVDQDGDDRGGGDGAVRLHASAQVTASDAASSTLRLATTNRPALSRAEGADP